MKQRDVLFFHDGTTRIDYILRYEESEEAKILDKRKVFEENLKDAGVLIEHETKEVMY